MKVAASYYRLMWTRNEIQTFENTQTEHKLSDKNININNQNDKCLVSLYCIKLPVYHKRSHCKSKWQQRFGDNSLYYLHIRRILRSTCRLHADLSVDAGEYGADAGLSDVDALHAASSITFYSFVCLLLILDANELIKDRLELISPE